MKVHGIEIASRKVKHFIELTEFMKSDRSENELAFAMIIHANESYKIGLNWFDRLFYRVVTIKRLLDLTPLQISEILLEVYKLDGMDIDKKKVEHQSGMISEPEQLNEIINTQETKS